MAMGDLAVTTESNYLEIDIVDAKLGQCNGPLIYSTIGRSLLMGIAEGIVIVLYAKKSAEQTRVILSKEPAQLSTLFDR